MANTEYAKSSHGVTKFFEFVALLLAWVFFYLYQDELIIIGKNRPQNYEDWDAVFFFVHLIGWLMVILFFIIFTCGLERILGFSKCWWFLAMFFHFCLAIGCVVAAGYWAKYVYDEQDKGLRGLKFLKPKAWNYILVADINGFIAFLFLMIDTFLSYRQLKARV